MDKNKYLVISIDVLPEVFVKVIEAKELIKTGAVKGITEAAKKVGISRSTYYKYNDHVFTLKEGAIGKKVTISLLLSHESGVLSNFLKIIANNNGNVLTISQDSPIKGIANATITFDISNINCTFYDLLEILKDLEGVKRLDLIAME
ncbi:ACT domain-containing protein [Helicovermis profundi]|uniref:UPF0735 ACT domain-containing protein HLPR_10230 n=1 Tax=Helicovermis profundi TaxID=3065157 RepID=A0AAU9EA30_9FIRM|nr:ACT domain-containing protein [Clostridia bacterium S502]